jgi:UDP-N-acetylmuramate dehydrogenase
VSVRWQIDAPLAPRTAWRVGGPARRLCVVRTREEFLAALASLRPEEPLLVLGLGSNLLVRDGGFAGAVIVTTGLRGLVREGPRIRVEAGLPCPTLARRLVRWGLAGGEFLAGIPGTVGGALRMNAGCFGSETWERVEEVETVDRSGVLRRRRAAEVKVGYRTVGLGEDEYVLAADLVFVPAESGDVHARLESFLARRRESQPLTEPNAGSVFLNPPGAHAARLIEEAGLKGCAVGGARVSERHANFIVTRRGARARDVEDLIRHVRETVLARSGVRLETEVRIVGEERAHAVA